MFIRTSYGVFEFKEDFGDNLIKTTRPYYLLGCFILKSDIVKQANTIEELVDLYVCVEKNGNHTILPTNSIISIIGTIIYGAIWTEKGLIYVAKMNENGEWELL